MSILTQRRDILKSIALTGAAAFAAIPVEAAAQPATGPLPGGALSLKQLSDRLAHAPRRRDFKTVPMILSDRNQWDAEALDEVLAYKPTTKQAWDVTDIAGPWLNVMRNSLNAQIWSFGHKDFLIASEIHGTAQVALYDQDIWDKYGLAKLAGGDFARNTLIEDRPAASADATDYENPAGVFSPENNSIPALQRRGVVFMSCHNAIWEQAIKLHATGANPDKLDVSGIAAELTNHLIPGVILTPGAVATLPELQRAGFAYAR
jgi:hypothetical protein